jgi:two-component system sensor histidine kinase PilS (NtrC family)
MQSMFDERVWLAWLVKVRIIILTVLLGIELAIVRLTSSPLPVRFFVSVMLLWYTFSVLYLLIESFWNEPRIESVVQVVVDLMLVTLVVYATGGVDSSLNFLYPLVIIVACILLPRVWAYLAAALAFILYGTAVELTYFEVIPSYSTSHPELKTLQAIIFVNLFAYLAIAYLAGLLVTKLRQADARLEHASGALENLQALHENIIQSISGGLITTGLDGRITFSNSSAQRLLESGERELWSAPIQALFQDPLPQVGAERAHGEVRFVGKNNYRKTFRVMVSPLSVPDREPMGFVYTFDDLTQIRRLEREVRLQDRLAAVGRLAAGIAHEIRNPLTSIAGSVSMLSEVPDLNDEHRRLLQIVTRESDRLNNIITDFLAYSRGKQYDFARIDLVALLEDTLTLLQNRLIVQETGIRIERYFDADQAWAMADGDKMKQVFWNFCENAVRAMSSGGKLKISIAPEGSDWEIHFADTGPGIDPQLVEKIFEPFQSQFEGGTGLGLALVYQIVQAHEGKVWARSKPGQGCDFVLRIRRSAAEGESVERRDAEEAEAGSQAALAVAATAEGSVRHG